MLVIVDYGMGNLRSVEKALERIGHGARVSARPEDVAGAERLIVPGVGAFGDAMAALRQRGLVEPIREFVGRGRPFLGICLGLQLLFEESDEGRGPAAEGALCPPAGGPRLAVSGLGLLKGRVVRFGQAVLAQGLKVPHMGWNVVRPARPCRLFAGMPPEGVYFYFAHSYYADPADRSVVAAETDYGGWFTSAVEAGNILATQFHPEKSQAAGLRLLENFIGRA